MSIATLETETVVDMTYIVDRSGKRMEIGLFRRCIIDLYSHGYLESFQFRQTMDAVLRLEQYGGLPGTHLFWNVNEQRWGYWIEMVEDLFTMYECAVAEQQAWFEVFFPGENEEEDMDRDFPFNMGRFRMNVCNATRPEFRYRGGRLTGIQRRPMMGVSLSDLFPVVIDLVDNDDDGSDISDEDWILGEI